MDGLNMEQDIVGIIYPLPKKLAEDILEKGKTIFYKYIGYIPKDKKNERLKKGMYLFIYQSGGTHQIIGKAVIGNIFYETAEEIMNNYSDVMMGSEPHLIDYSEGREEKKLRVLSLKNIKKFDEPLPYDKHISLSGRYMDSEYYKKIKN